MHTADPLYPGKRKTLLLILSWYEFMDTKPRDMEGRLYIYGGNWHISEPMQFKPVLFKGQLYMQP